MANLTLTIDEATLRRARLRAVREGTSVNAVVREFLTRWAGDDAAKAALARFVEAARASTAGSGPEGRTWRREDLYDERIRGG